MTNVKECLFNIMCEVGYKDYGFSMPFGAGDFYKGIRLLSNERTITVTVREDEKVISVKCEVPRNKEREISDNWKTTLPRILVKHFGAEWTVIPVKSVLENSEMAVTQMSIQNSEETIKEIEQTTAESIKELLQEVFGDAPLEEVYDDSKMRTAVTEQIEKALKEKGIESLTETNKRKIVNSFMQDVYAEINYDPSSGTIMKEVDPDAEEYEGEEDEFDPVQYEQEHSGKVLGNWSDKLYDDDAEVVTPEIVIEEQKLKGERDTDEEIESPKVSAGELVDVIKDLDIPVEEAKEMIESMKNRIIEEIGEEGYNELAESILEQEEKIEEEDDDEEETIHPFKQVEIFESDGVVVPNKDEEENDNEDDDLVLEEFKYDEDEEDDDWMDGIDIDEDEFF